MIQVHFYENVKNMTGRWTSFGQFFSFTISRLEIYIVDTLKKKNAYLYAKMMDIGEKMKKEECPMLLNSI